MSLSLKYLSQGKCLLQMLTDASHDFCGDNVFLHKNSAVLEITSIAS